ncbi:hypothetical protein NIES4074_16470 [Cylindrospermum sp. NIES-4074]|nr:hypothetical protein NIES4074_16470 [Cylindrospermum sp. NIES-4074]
MQGFLLILPFFLPPRSSFLTLKLFIYLAFGFIQQALIRLKVEKCIEEGQKYFVATSDDLQGLVAEGKTVQEAIEIAENVAKILLDLEKENNHDIQFQGLPPQFEYPLIMEV